MPLPSAPAQQQPGLMQDASVMCAEQARTTPVPHSDQQKLLSSKICHATNPTGVIGRDTSKWHRLADNPEPHQRRRAAMKSMSPELLVHLSADPHHLVREGVAANPATSHELLTTLAGDPNTHVTHTAQMSLAHESDTQYRHRSRDFVYKLERQTNN